MIHHSRALAALAGVAALTLTGVAPASAARWTHDDAVGDVQSLTDPVDPGTGDSPDSEPVALPDNTDTDVTRVTVSHRTHRVVLDAALRDVQTTSGFLAYDIRTGTRRYVVMQRLGSDRTVPAFLFERANGHRVRCAGAEHSVDRAADTATLNIPRHCLGAPRWVRVGVGAAKFAETDTTTTFVADDALQDAVVKDDLALSPRVRRG